MESRASTETEPSETEPSEGAYCGGNKPPHYAKMLTPQRCCASNQPPRNQPPGRLQDLRVEGRGDDSSGHCLVGREPAVLHPEIRHWRAVLPAPKERAAIQATVDRGLLISRLRDLERRPEERPELVQGQFAAAAVWGLRRRRGRRLRPGRWLRRGGQQRREIQRRRRPPRQVRRDRHWCCSAAAQIRKVAEQQKDCRRLPGDERAELRDGRPRGCKKLGNHSVRPPKAHVVQL
jgi:hypothetical protein